MPRRLYAPVLCLLVLCTGVPAVSTAQWSDPGVFWSDAWDDAHGLDIDDSGTRLVTLIPYSGSDENNRSVEVSEQVLGVWQTPIVLARNGHFSDEAVQQQPQITTPVISGDGETIVYLGYTGTAYAVYISYRQEGTWTTPAVLPTGLDSYHYWLSLSRDGSTLALSNYPFSGDLHVYVMTRNQQGWGAPVQVDSGYTGGQFPSLSADGTRLVWVSNARVTYSHLQDGAWSTPQELTSNIWSEYRVEYPQMAADGASLYYWYVTLEANGASYTKVSQDLYVMRRSGDTWQAPEKVNGDPVTPAEDVVVVATADEHATRLVYTRPVIHNDVIDSSSLEVSEWQGGTSWSAASLVVEDGFGNYNRFPKLTPDGLTLLFDGRDRYTPSYVERGLWEMHTTEAPPAGDVIFNNGFESGSTSLWSAVVG